MPACPQGCHAGRPANRIGHASVADEPQRGAGVGPDGPGAALVHDPPMTDATTAGRARVLVAGAGMAGLEAALALDGFLGDDARVTVVDARGRFAVPATAAGRAFGIDPAVDVPLARLLSGTRIALRHARIVAVDPRRRLAMLAGGELLAYDDLVVALGARGEPPLGEALTFRGHADAQELRGLVDGVAEHADRGASTDLVVVIPRGCGWPLVGYDIALMAREHLVAKGHGDRCRVRVVTAEDVPLADLGPEAGGSVTQTLARAGVGIVTSADVTGFAWGLLRAADGRTFDADRIIALPVTRGPALEGLPMDPQGFVRCDPEGRVEGAPGVRVVGDAGTFPVKEGGTAVLQADAVAASIARAHGADADGGPFPSRPPARWPVPKVTGRFLAPVLQELAAAGPDGRRPRGRGRRAGAGPVS